MKNKGTYNFSFTSGSLLPSEMRLLATEYIRVGDWETVQRECGTGNLLTYRTLVTRRKFGAIIISRLKEFSPGELSYFTEADTEDGRLLCWVAVCRRYAFIRDFMAEVVRERYLSGMQEVTYSDYSSFFSDKAQYHPEMEKLSEQTQGKIRQMVFKMMTEAGIIENKTRIVPTVMPPKLLELLSHEDYLCFPMFVRED